MQTTTTTQTAAPVRQKLDLGGLGKKKAAGTKTSYPVMPETEESAELVRIIRQEAAEFDALKGSFEIHKSELAALAAPFYFQNGHGQLEVPSSIACHATSEHVILGSNVPGIEEVLVCFQSRYKETTDDAPILAVMGKERFAKYIRDSFSIKIDGDLVPLASAQELITELQELFAKHNAAGALTAKQIVKPTPNFHAARHTAFDPEENQAINLALPIVVQVKTKGRGAH